MDTCKVKWTRLQWQIFRLLCIRAGQSLNLRETAKLLKVTPTAVSNALHALEKDKLLVVQKSKTMNLLSIRFNRDNLKAVELKRAENLRMISESGVSDFLSEEFPGCAITLFGSYSRGEDTWMNDDIKSDIDIAIVGTKGKRIDLAPYEKMLERKISLNHYTSWKNIHTDLRNNILNGILLKGSVEL